MIAKSKLAILALATSVLCGGLTAHVRLFNPNNQKKLYWENPTKIRVVIDPAGSSDISDDSEATAVRLGMRAWNAVSGSKARLVEKSASFTSACSEWTEFSTHLVFFDEANCSGFFPGGSQAVAVTPVVFLNDGEILDADVLFNGLDFSFTTSGDPGAYDVQDVGTHELGHLLGLDHSGWAGATMYPYVDPNVLLQRSLSQDDARGLRHAYPAGAQGRIKGQVLRLADGTGVAGAHVVALDAGGRTAAAALADGGGSYNLRGLDAGTYTVCANPLEGTVTAGNLQAGRTIETDFEATAGPVVVLASGKTETAPDLWVEADVSIVLGQKWDLLPLEARAGSTIGYFLSGSSLVPGSTLTPGDPSITLGNVNWLVSGSSVSFTVTTPPGAAPGHVDLVADNGGDRAVLVAALEIVPPAPTVTGVSPTKVNEVGGETVTITGTGFLPGACVVLGPSIYCDGELGGCTVVDPNTITLTTAASTLGTFDVVVMDATGVEGRDPGGLTVASIPILTTRFPASGSAAGGTELILTGDNFQPGLTVRIDGVVQSAVTLEGATTARVTTEPGLAGGPYLLEVENPGGEAATSAFSYVAQPDPALLDVTPGSGAPAGGKLVTVSGSGFTGSTEVEFDVDPLTGLGGTPADSVVFVDASTLQVTTPALSAGRGAVLTRNAGQASILPDAFLAKSPEGGGGGGCYAAPFDSGARPDPLLGAAGVLLLVALVVGYAGLTRRRAAVHS